MERCMMVMVYANRLSPQIGRHMILRRIVIGPYVLSGENLRPSFRIVLFIDRKPIISFAGRLRCPSHAAVATADDDDAVGVDSFFSLHSFILLNLLQLFNYKWDFFYIDTFLNFVWDFFEKARFILVLSQILNTF